AIKTARYIHELRLQYSIASSNLKRLSRNYQCDCILAGLCETEMEPATQEEYYEVCIKVENDQLQNDAKLVQIFSELDNLKSMVLKLGGYWLELPENESVNFVFKTLEVDLKKGLFTAADQTTISSNGLVW